MKWLMILAGCVFFLLMPAGCNKAGVTAAKNIEAVTEDSNDFPEFLVGTWKANRGAWQLEFGKDGKDGKIISVISGPNQQKMFAGKTKTQTKAHGYQNIYKPGLWKVAYSNTDKTLDVQVDFDYIKLERPEGYIEGSSSDLFIGRVIENGVEWQAEWFSYPRYVIYNPDPYEMSWDPNKNPVDNLVFIKAED